MHSADDAAPDTDPYCPTSHPVHSTAATVSTKVPAPQLAQLGIPDDAAKAPAAQSVQLVAPEFAAYWPAAQLVHWAASAAAYVPLGQLMHDGMPAAAYWPAAQLTHAADSVAPIATPYMPEGQAVQLDAPDCVENDPDTHIAHAAAPAADDEPASQTRQLVDANAPVAARYCPAAHAVHCSRLTVLA